MRMYGWQLWIVVFLFSQVPLLGQGDLGNGYGNYHESRGNPPPSRRSGCGQMVMAVAVGFLVGISFNDLLRHSPPLALHQPVPHVDEMMLEGTTVVPSFEHFRIQNGKIVNSQGHVVPGSERTKDIAAIGPRLARIREDGPAEIYSPTSKRWITILDEKCSSMLGSRTTLGVITETGDFLGLAVRGQGSIIENNGLLFADGEPLALRRIESGLTGFLIVPSPAKLEIDLIHAVSPNKSVILFPDGNVKILRQVEKGKIKPEDLKKLLDALKQFENRDKPDEPGLSL